MAKALVGGARVPRLRYPVTFPTWAMVFARRLFPARFNHRMILGSKVRKPTIPGKTPR